MEDAILVDNNRAEEITKQVFSAFLWDAHQNIDQS